MVPTASSLPMNCCDITAWLDIPDFRSNELWEDQECTYQVQVLQALDLLLWNKTEDPWGAHVGAYVGEQ